MAPTQSPGGQVAADMTALFESVEGLADVDNYMSQPYEAWRRSDDTPRRPRPAGVDAHRDRETLSTAMGAQDHRCP